MTPIRLTDAQIRIGAALGLAHVVMALIAHFTVPAFLEGRLGLVAEPWFRRETGTTNAGFAYGIIRILQGHRDATFIRATAISGLLMATVRTLATLRGHRRGPLSALVVGSDLLLGIGGLVLAGQFDTDKPRHHRDILPSSANSAIPESVSPLGAAASKAKNR
ncbi:hypothetical protein [Mycobacterium celatum]|uniref:Uncharacterized protein n=1 Tax=Mycobacterium celatum TaxID=28045 RepID=A0A1X1RR42_MYCCE|nr:hypothetical protein [Mycobacterium celatum]ORV13480.1 hypothetical protein AWB95_11665 [Mycobacterium celatum]PIB78090.1 hypothetical protein CQY23_15205 [Mycobacterium celatum]